MELASSNRIRDGTHVVFSRFQVWVFVFADSVVLK